MDRRGARIAVFSAIVEADGSRDNLLCLTPALAMDGGTAPRDGDLDVPVVCAVRLGDSLLGDGEAIALGRASGRLDIEVEMPAECAVTIGARLVPAEAPE
jgi:hypothetical protein